MAGITFSNRFIKTCLCVSPLPLNCAFRHPLHLGDFPVFEAAEKFEDGDPGAFGILSFEAAQGFIDHEDSLIRGCICNLQLVNVQPLSGTTALEAGFVPGSIHQDAPHCLSGNAEKVRPITPSAIFSASQPQPCLVDERSRLQSLARCFSI